MRDYVKRLIDCGFPRDVALAVCRSYLKRNDVYGLDQYVYSVEQEHEYSFEKEEMNR